MATAARDTTNGTAPPGRRRAALVWSTLLAIPFLLLLLPLPPEVTEKSAKYYLHLLFAAGALVSAAGHPLPLFVRQAGRRAVFLALGYSAAVVALQSANLLAFLPTEYHVREGVRQKATRFIAERAPRGARVYWVVGPDNDGHAWASQMHLKLFFGRDDLIDGPASWVITQGEPRAGDLIVNYTNNPALPMAGQGSLGRSEVQDGGMTFAARNTRDIRKLLAGALFHPRSFDTATLQTALHNVTIPIYVVRDRFDFTPEFRKQYLGAK